MKRIIAILSMFAVFLSGCGKIDVEERRELEEKLFELSNYSEEEIVEITNTLEKEGYTQYIEMDYYYYDGKDGYSVDEYSFIVPDKKLDGTLYSISLSANTFESSSFMKQNGKYVNYVIHIGEYSYVKVATYNNDGQFENEFIIEYKEGNFSSGEKSLDEHIDNIEKSMDKAYSELKNIIRV